MHLNCHIYHNLLTVKNFIGDQTIKNFVSKVPTCDHMRVFVCIIYARGTMNEGDKFRKHGDHVFVRTCVNH